MYGIVGELRSDIHNVVIDVNFDMGVDAILVAAGWPTTLQEGGRPLVFVSSEHGKAWDIAYVLLRKWTRMAGPFIDKMAHRAASKIAEQYRCAPKSVLARQVAATLISEGQKARDKIARRLGRKHGPKFSEYGHG